MQQPYRQVSGLENSSRTEFAEALSVNASREPASSRIEKEFYAHMIWLKKCVAETAGPEPDAPKTV